MQPFSDTEINKIINASINNVLIVKGYTSKSYLEKWIKKYDKIINISEKTKLKEKLQLDTKPSQERDEDSK